MTEPQSAEQGFKYLWQMVTGGGGILGLLAFLFREKLADAFKKKDIPTNEVITRGEFEPRMKAVTDEIHFIHTDLSDKLLAHAAQARQDSKDSRQWQEAQFKAQWEKLDGLTTQILLNQKAKQ